jgi:bifunctional non-homologous end joining protein LigD
MDYNQFEGVIPEGEYGGGTVMIWDKGIWAAVTDRGLGGEGDADRQLKKGELKFVLLGEKLKGSWVLVRTGGTRQWLLIKHRDEYAGGEDLAVTRPLSVVSGRTLAQISKAAGGTARQMLQAAGADPPEVGREAAATPATRTRRAPSPTRGRRGAARAAAR